MAINFPSTAGQATDGSYTYNVAGIIYAWNGSSWEAAGAGASATDRTLFSVTQNAVGTAALSYTSGTGVFSYTPPDLSGYLTAEADTLDSVVGRGATTSVKIIANGGVRASVLGVGGGIGNGDVQLQHNGTTHVSTLGHYNINGSFDIISVGKINLKPGSDSGNSVDIYHNIDGSTEELRIQTTNTGVTISGALTAGGLTYPSTNGTSGDVLTSDGAGSVTWTAPTGLQTRGTALVTQSIANGAVSNLSITTPKTYVLYSIQTSHAAWVTLYSDTTSRTNDSTRSETTDPTPGSGVLTEVITTGAATQLITPGTICFNSAAAGITYAKIVNKSGSTANISVTLTYLKLED